MHLTRFIVLWAQAGRRSGLHFEADVYSTSPALAREEFLRLFPGEHVAGVKLPRGNGRFI